MEIYYNSTWGTVCDDLWDINDAQVVCRQLGYPSAVSAPLYARFGQGSGRIWLENVQCQGNENYIRHCRWSRPWGFHDCDHSEDASVICSSKSTWSYENRVSKHFAIFLNFPCLIPVYCVVFLCVSFFWGGGGDLFRGLFDQRLALHVNHYVYAHAAQS